MVQICRPHHRILIPIVLISIGGSVGFWGDELVHITDEGEDVWTSVAQAKGQ